jgi:hypothetical protein
MMATYVGVFVLALVGIVASRRTAWLLRIIGFRRQRSLPSPRRGPELPEEKRDSP